MKAFFGAAMLAVVLGLAAAPSATAQTVSRIDITEYGIYTADISETEHTANGVGHNTLVNIHHAETTTTVPTQHGVHFGLRYRIIGSPDGAKVAIRKVWIYPAGGLKPPNSPTPLKRISNTLTRLIGQTSYTDYSLDDPWELVPGTWTLQLWVGSRKLAEKSFTVVAR